MNKCNACGKEYSPECDYRQGRCPLHPPLYDQYHARFLNLINAIRNLFKK